MTDIIWVIRNAGKRWDQWKDKFFKFVTVFVSETDHYNELLYNSEFQLRVRDPEENSADIKQSASYDEFDQKLFLWIPVESGINIFVQRCFTIQRWYATCKRNYQMSKSTKTATKCELIFNGQRSLERN